MLNSACNPSLWRFHEARQLTGFHCTSHCTLRRSERGGHCGIFPAWWAENAGDRLPCDFTERGWFDPRGWHRPRRGQGQALRAPAGLRPALTPAPGGAHRPRSKQTKQDQIPVKEEPPRFEPPACEVLAQRDDRHEADHADEDDRALNDAKSDMPIATLSWMRLAMRQRTTAVAMFTIASRTSSSAPAPTRVSAPDLHRAFRSSTAPGRRPAGRGDLPTRDSRCGRRRWTPQRSARSRKLPWRSDHHHLQRRS